MAASPTLTQKQQKVLDMITANIDRGCPPTLQEIADHFDLGISTVQDHVAALEAKGVLSRQKDKARSFRVVGRAGPGSQVRLPIVGRVIAGVPVEAVEDVSEHLVLDRAVAKNANFILRVRGDSMAPDIVEGDLLLVRQADDARNGESVVAHVGNEGEATVKRLKKANGQVWLEAVNPKYAPIKARNLRVIGRVVGLVRKFG